jgi:hypothetical protein
MMFWIFIWATAPAFAGDSFGRDFVELSPQLVDKFKKYEEAFEADAQVKTLPDINNRLLEQQTKARSMQADVEENRRLATSKRARYLTLGDTAKIDKAVIDMMDERVSPTDKLMARYDLTDMTKNAVKGELFMQMRLLRDSGLSDDAIKAITEFGVKKGVTKDLGPSFDDFKKNNEAFFKELAGIRPDARVIGDPNVLRLDASEAASLAVNKEKFDTVAELALTMANRAKDELVSPAISNPKFLQTIADVVPDALKDINISNIRKDFDEYADMTAKTRRLREDASNAAEDARKISEERSEIVGQTLDRVAGNDRAAYEQYRYETKKSGVLPKDDVEFVPNNPFKTQSQASRYQLHQAIKKAAQDGSHRYYFPDYEDIAALREEKADLFKTTYKDVPNKVIKELKAMYPDMEVGVVNPADIGNIGQSDTPMLKAKKPMRYIDLTPLQGKSAQVRRYKDGGGVDLRAGIGSTFKLYS